MGAVEHREPLNGQLKVCFMFQFCSFQMCVVWQAESNSTLSSSSYNLIIHGKELIQSQ